MKKTLLILFFALPVYTFAQEQFVEVIIEDSIQIDPDEYYFTIMVQNDYIADTTMDSLDFIPQIPTIVNQSSQIENRFTLLDQLIKKMGVDTVQEIQTAIMGERYPYTVVYKTLKFSTIEILSAFIKQAKLIPGVTGNITRLHSFHYEQRLPDLSNKLLEKCKTKAAYIARKAHKTLGSIQQVKEEYLEQKGGWTMYAPLSLAYQAQSPTEIETIIVWKKMTLRMSWK